MAGLKEIRTRIASVVSTSQITSAMKMVSAAKLRRAQEAIQQIRPYSNKLHELLSDISASIDATEDNVFAQVREPKKILYVAITSNRGLCGAFNTNIVKRCLMMAERDFPEQLANGRVEFAAIGKKAADLFKSRKVKVVQQYGQVFEKLSFENVVTVADQLMDNFTEKIYDRIFLVYNQFKNAGVQIVTEEQFLPIEVTNDGEHHFNRDYLIEPSKEYVVEVLIPKSLKIMVYKALLDSVASEHGARMTAMHKATDNARQLLKDLRINYNKARQASITNEILEIVGGANALKK